MKDLLSDKKLKIATIFSCVVNEGESNIDVPILDLEISGILPPISRFSEEGELTKKMHLYFRKI